MTDWGRQMMQQVRRWLPQRAIVIVADSSFAALELLWSVSQMPRPVHMVTRLRLDAALYEPATPYRKGQMGRPRLKGKRLPTLYTLLADPQTVWQQIRIQGWYGGTAREVELVSDTAVWYHTGLLAVPIRWVLVRDPQGKFEPQAFLCTNLTVTPVQILVWFRRRWQVEVTFEEVHRHLGMETQRQWADLAILRTTPALLGLFSFVTLLANQCQLELPLRQAAWYVKPLPTFVDALALVRCLFWKSRLFQTSTHLTEVVKVPQELFNCWNALLCYAA